MADSPSESRPLARITLGAETSPFCKKIIAMGYSDENQIRKAIRESRRSGQDLMEVLQKFTGNPLSPELLRQYKRQQLFELKILYGIDSLDPELDQIPTDQLDELIQTLIPLDICRRYQLLPLSLNRNADPPCLLVAMVNPDDLGALDDLGRILRPQGMTLQRMVIAPEDYQKLIAKHLDEQVKQQDQINNQVIEFDLEDDLDAIVGLEEVSDELETDLATALQDAETAPIITLVNKILAKALQEGVSDIHIEPQEEHLRVRFRKDGVLQQAFDPLPRKIIPGVVSRFKIIADLDIAERRLPQDGRIRRLFQGRKIDFRVSTLPNRYGEKVVLRILDNSSTQLGLDKLITDPQSLEIVRDMVSRPFGLILVTGPTGSGKTTTLYSALSECNDPAVNISTAEDPIEYTLPGLTQVQVIREKGMDFASILRAFLRQDPDVILVGETLDKETAKTAIEAAFKGHLVLTNLYTNDAASAIARLAEMEVEPFMVSGSLIGVIAQRLVRRVCPECRVPYQPTPTELARFGLSTEQGTEITFHKANTLSLEDIQAAQVADQPICSVCNGIGYAGRCGVYEVMQASETLQALIAEGASSERIKEVAVDEGMHTLLSYSLNLVKRGETTLEEVERVTFADSGLEAELKAKRKQQAVDKEERVINYHEYSIPCPKGVQGNSRREFHKHLLRFHPSWPCDKTCKFLAESFPNDFASWLLEEPISLSQLSPSELSIEPFCADASILLASNEIVVHCEFRTEPDQNIAFLMADYRLKVFREFPKKRMHQVVIYLTRSTSDLVQQTTFEIPGNMRHEFEVIRLWEQPPEVFLEPVGLLPLAVLSKTSDQANTLRKVASQIEKIPDLLVQSDLVVSTRILAGLLLKQEFIHQVLGRELVQQSEVYQGISQECEDRGALKEGQSLVLRQLPRRIGDVSPDLQAQVKALSLPQIDNLGEALLDFSEPADLVNWLQAL